MAPHSSTLAWRIPWTEEPGGLQSMQSLRVRHDWATSLSLSCMGEGNGNPLQCSCLENPRDGEAWWAAVYGVAQSRTRLKWLSRSSSAIFIFKFFSVFFISDNFYWSISISLAFSCHFYSTDLPIKLVSFQISYLSVVFSFKFPSGSFAISISLLKSPVI